ncbi:MAG: aminoglycoside phosphotransferase family protein [Chloroflexi bacterium]|nr:aminoglycoside phosphotransferase family protein [Chloroflexota bacterium]
MCRGEPPLTPLSKAAAATVATRLIGSVVDQVRAVSSFAGNQVFRVTLADRVWYLKLAIAAGARRNLQTEVSVLGTVRGHGVPVPPIAASEATGDLAGAPCLLLDDVGGRPLTGTEPEFRFVGAHLRSIHELALVGFGALSTQREMRGKDDSWAETVQRPLAAIRPAVDAGLVEEALITRLSGAVELHQNLFEVPHSRLLHGDFHPRHVYARAGEISGIIDWGDAMSGDPVYDLGRVLHSGMQARGLDFGLSLVRAVIDGYGDAPWLHDDLVTRMLLYAAIFIIKSMEGEFSSGAPWPPFWPVQCRRPQAAEPWRPRSSAGTGEALPSAREAFRPGYRGRCRAARWTRGPPRAQP